MSGKKDMQMTKPTLPIRQAQGEQEKEKHLHFGANTSSTTGKTMCERCG
mgnify:CR=1 FL=1